MKCLKPLLFLVFSVFAACNCTYQYDVYVINETDSTLKVVYKSIVDRKGVVEDVTTISPGKQERIINSIDIDVDNNCAGTSALHCNYVAEYVHVFKNDTLQGKIQWCDKEVVFQKVDIQQGEFLMRYTNDDF